ncbi:hypothetical protein CH063_01452 [Colletotrichum higginsianum]|uniref:Uncharacterized protein n=1 Tax=Colletotrichum higginsianum (strain IMI 349063) TaxID=759273 RepID=H1V7J9_COLHI|nr:hypothetical protein CH063_01452 [Colletotrichum higginsianum]
MELCLRRISRLTAAATAALRPRMCVSYRVSKRAISLNAEELFGRSRCGIDVRRRAWVEVEARR